MTVFLAANRSPVSLIETDEGVRARPGQGGLVSLLTEVANSLPDDDLTWVAAASTESERQLASSPSHRSAGLLPADVRFVDIPPDVYARYYNDVSNRMLWFTHHRLLDELKVPTFGVDMLREWREAYSLVNRRFAELLAAVARTTDLVLLQDYHLALVPGWLRRLAPELPIAHFTHTPFGTPADMDRLPGSAASDLLDGMLGADLLGFHTRRWSDAFLDCCEWKGHRVDRARGLVTHGGRRTFVRDYPAPVEAAALRRMARSDRTSAWAAHFAGDPRTMVVRADRVDPSKNIVRGFEAFGLLLDRRPDLRRRTRFVASLFRSRGEVPEYARYSERVAATIRAVNDRHEGAVEVFWDEDRERSLAAMRRYDVLLVNPLLDGMNVVSKEGPAINERAGVLVLSEGAGSADELGGSALLVDPLDVEATARALERALEMPQHERQARADSLRAIVEERTPEVWLRDQVSDLRAVAREGEPRERLREGAGGDDATGSRSGGS
jgi:trehalose 6-phosphate synthase